MWHWAEQLHSGCGSVPGQGEVVGTWSSEEQEMKGTEDSWLMSWTPYRAH